MPGGFPDCGVHENGGIDADDVVVEHGHGLPPVAFYVVLEFHTVLGVVIHGAQAVINLAAREYEAVFLGMGYNRLEDIFLLCHIYIYVYFQY